MFLVLGLCDFSFFFHHMIHDPLSERIFFAKPPSNHPSPYNYSSIITGAVEFSNILGTSVILLAEVSLCDDLLCSYLLLDLLLPGFFPPFLMLGSLPDLVLCRKNQEPVVFAFKGVGRGSRGLFAWLRRRSISTWGRWVLAVLFGGFSVFLMGFCYSMGFF
jgi:hypothetical protein